MTPLLHELWLRIITTFGTKPRSANSEPSRARKTTRRRRYVYTGRDSGTRDAILRILSDGRPRTRHEISERLDVTTASIHLPRMVDDGVLLCEYRGRRMVYWVREVSPNADAVARAVGISAC